MHECPICWERKYLTTISPCKHKFCSDCLIKQFKYQHKCAMCRATVISCSPPLNKKHTRIGLYQTPHEHCFVINKTKHESIGFTFKLANDRVVLISVETDSIAQKNGLCCSDIITSINGVHIFSTEWVRYALKESEIVNLTVIPATPIECLKNKCFSCFAKILPK